jgi:hypothetical protein
VTQFFALIVSAAALLSFVGGVMVGSNHANKALEKFKAEVALANKVTEAEMARLAAYSQALEEQLKKRKTEIRTVTNEIVKEIPKLVGSGYCINSGWVRVHDAAAGVSLPAAEFVGPTQDVTAARAAEVVVTNYGECNVWREQLLGWQKWHGEESESKRRINNILRSAQ